MVRFNDKPAITKIAGNDIIPMTDVSESRDDKKVTVDQLSQYTLGKVDKVLDNSIAIPNHSKTKTYSKQDWVAGKQFDLSKFTVVGNPTISENGIASGFNGQGVFVHIPNFSFTTNKTIFAGSFILNEFSDNSDILTMQTDSYLTLRCAGNKIAILLGNGNTWIINQLDNSNLKLNYKYYYKLIINTSKVEIYLSENGVDYINTLSLNTTLGLQETTGLLTVGNKITAPDETFTGQIDLSSIRITVDGEEVFSGLSDEKSIYQSKVDDNTGHDLGNEEYWENIGVKKPEVAITTYDSKASYSENAWVVGEIEGEKLIFKSLVNNNIGKTLDDEDAWEELKLGGGGSGLEVCDIGISLFVDESKGLRRYLNGSIVAINKNTSYFANRLKAIATQYPTLTCTEDEWQAIASFSVGNQCGKFVIDETAGTIRLPRIIMPIQGLTDLSKLAEIVEAGLPNITGNVGVGDGNVSGNTPTGAFYKTNDISYGPYASYGNTNTMIKFNATRSNSIYGNSTTVQQEAIQYPYFIQIATGAETEYEITNEHMINQPFSLFDSKYSDIEIYNASWLKSNNQWNSGATYVTAYEALVVEQNTAVLKGQTVTLPSGNVQYIKRGVSVKLSTASDITDYDFVINTTNNTFRLPLKSKLASGKAVVGNGMTLGWTNGTTLFGSANGNNSDYGFIGARVIYGKPVGTQLSGDTPSPSDVSMGITTDPTKSGIETADNNLYLYYFVGDTLINPSLIATENVLNTVAGMSKSYLVEFYTNGTSWYRVFSDGWCEQGGIVSGASGQNNITLLKSYKDTSYNLIALCHSNNLYATGNRIDTKTIWLETRGHDFTVQPCRAIWRAYGYIE